MSRKFYSQPDFFSMQPLLVLLPDRGDVGELAKLVPSFYARFEKASSMLSHAEGVMSRRISAEKIMLQQLLEKHQIFVEDNESDSGNGEGE